MIKKWSIRKDYDAMLRVVENNTDDAFDKTKNAINEFGGSSLDEDEDQIVNNEDQEMIDSNVNDYYEKTNSILQSYD
jgi:hypothetical protein